MSVEALIRIPCTLLRRTQDGPPDEHGNPTWQEERQETRCELQQTSATEELGDAVQSSRWRLFLPADAPARGWDEVELEDGTRLTLTGDAWPFRNPRTEAVSHVEAEVLRVE